jgi:tRNA (cmo5U34)-methyltransferase
MFDFNSIENFDEHIDSSIPSYSVMAQMVRNVSPWFLSPSKSVIDLGCSTGKLLESIHHDGIKYGIDIATNLLPESKPSCEYLNVPIQFLEWDKFVQPSLVLSIFTLQFLPMEDRITVLQNVYDSLSIGGAFIWAEKIVNEFGDDQELFDFAHYDFKREHFTAEEILDKERDLRKLLRPNTTAINLEFAHQAGFNNGVLLWKFLNFECWLFRK